VENTTATAEQHEYLTVAEVSSRFRVSVPTIYRRCADGTLPHIRIGGDGPIRIPADQLQRLYEQAASDDGSLARGSFAGTNPAGAPRTGRPTPPAVEPHPASRDCPIPEPRLELAWGGRK
jgi:excisionase family DNA binding protein